MHRIPKTVGKNKSINANKLFRTSLICLLSPFSQQNKTKNVIEIFFILIMRGTNTRYKFRIESYKQLIISGFLFWNSEFIACLICFRHWIEKCKNIYINIIANYFKNFNFGSQCLQVHFSHVRLSYTELWVYTSQSHIKNFFSELQKSLNCEIETHIYEKSLNCDIKSIFLKPLVETSIHDND